MLRYVLTEDTTYQLKGGIDNINWVEASSTGGGGVDPVPIGTFMFGILDISMALPAGLIRCDDGTVYNKIDFPELVTLIENESFFHSIDANTFEFVNILDEET